MKISSADLTSGIEDENPPERFTFYALFLIIQAKHALFRSPRSTKTIRSYSMRDGGEKRLLTHKGQLSSHEKSMGGEIDEGFHLFSLRD